MKPTRPHRRPFGASARAASPPADSPPRSRRSTLDRLRPARGRRSRGGSAAAAPQPHPATRPSPRSATALPAQAEPARVGQTRCRQRPSPRRLRTRPQSPKLRRCRDRRATALLHRLYRTTRRQVQPVPAAQPQRARRSRQSCAPRRLDHGIEPIRERPQGSGAGAVIGGVLGGVVGNQFGHGLGRAAMTGVGAAGGAIAGNNVERNYNTACGRLSRPRPSRRRHDAHLPAQQVGNLHVGDRVRLDANGLAPRPEPPAVPTSAPRRDPGRRRRLGLRALARQLLSRRPGASEASSST